jgi:hypothetical protein
MIKTIQESPTHLRFYTDYDSYLEFAEDTRFDIYNSIYDIFTRLLVENKPELKMIVAAKVDGEDWTTNFTFTKNDTIVIKRDLLPFFENLEDYEMCDNIKKLYKDLN